jgi:hypothetical protein
MTTCSSAGGAGARQCLLARWVRTQSGSASGTSSAMAFKHSFGVWVAWSALAVVAGCSEQDGGTPLGCSPSEAGMSSEACSPSEAGSPSTPAAGEGGSGGEAPMPQGGEAAAQGGQAPLGGAEGEPPGELVPCDSADCCTAKGGNAVGVELLNDGGFETGTPSEGSPWSEMSTTNGNALIINNLSLGFKPKAGAYFVYLSGIASEESTIRQTVVVPEDAGWMVVSGYRLFQVDSQDDVNLDFCRIGLYGHPARDALELPFYWGRPTDTGDGWGDSRTWKFFEASWDAAPHQGLQREILFRGSSDDYSTDPDLSSSSYLFDELSLKAFRCYL